MASLLLLRASSKGRFSFLSKSFFQEELLQRADSTTYISSSSGVLSQRSEIGSWYMYVVKSEDRSQVIDVGEGGTVAVRDYALNSWEILFER
jgi:hypothetical protein